MTNATGHLPRKRMRNVGKNCCCSVVNSERLQQTHKRILNIKTIQTTYYLYGRTLSSLDRVTSVSTSTCSWRGKGRGRGRGREGEGRGGGGEGRGGGWEGRGGRGGGEGEGMGGGGEGRGREGKGRGGGRRSQSHK